MKINIYIYILCNLLFIGNFYAADIKLTKVGDRYTDPTSTMPLQLCSCDNLSCQKDFSFGKDLDKLTVLLTMHQFRNAILEKLSPDAKDGLLYIISILDIQNLAHFDEKVFFEKQKARQESSRKLQDKDDKKGIAVEKKDPHELTMLQILCSFDMNDIGFKIDINRDEYKPLHWIARMHERPDHARILLSFGVDPNPLNEQFKTPLDLALERRNKQMAECFIDHGGRCSKPSSIRFLLEKNVLKRIILPISLQERIS